MIVQWGRTSGSLEKGRRDRRRYAAGGIRENADPGGLGRLSGDWVTATRSPRGFQELIDLAQNVRFVRDEHVVVRVRDPDHMRVGMLDFPNPRRVMPYT